MDVNQISEDFLHYLWKLQKINTAQLSTVDNLPIEIINAGQHNLDAGPDFFGAKIKIGDTLWAGNVEIHVKSSMWNDHNHQKDGAYNNVILHVVFDHNTEVQTKSGIVLPVLEIKNLIQPKLFSSYLSLSEAKSNIPCAKRINAIEDFTISSMIQKAAIERIEHKTKDIARILEFTNGNWESCCYILIARYFGARVNKEPFERLARSLPLAVIGKHKNSIEQIEALLLGQSGLLPNNHKNPIVVDWAKEYQFLKTKYDLRPVALENWKFSRMRPVAFPTIRISQLADLLYRQEHLFSKMLSAKNAQELVALFDISASPFWDNHYHFNKASDFINKKMGRSSIDVICINAVAPLLFYYGQQTDNQEIKNKAIDLLQTIKPEKNKVTREWQELGIIAATSLESQGLIELKQNYCRVNRCLHCNIGNSVMQLG